MAPRRRQRKTTNPDGIRPEIQRAIESKQPRFSGTLEQRNFFISILNFVQSTIESEPAYAEDSRQRDAWLANIWHVEPHLAGVLSSATAIDKNRGWTLIGGRNQINRYTAILHNFEVAPNVRGWRIGVNAAALSYYTQDMGTVVEVGREGRSGPLRALYHVDPSTCRLTGLSKTPLEYSPSDGNKPQTWRPGDYFRIASMPSTLESYKGLGYCALSRMLELTKLMVAVFEHDREALGSKAPKGLLLLSGISEEQWDNANQIREARSEAKELEYFKSVMVLASGSMEQTDAKLIALSNLPANFNLREFVSLLMYGYALCIGYDPSEFYPVQFGALGRGTEMEVQHEKATTKGKLDFANGFQEQLQAEGMLPDTLEFNFDERDDQGEMIQAQVKQAYADLVETMRRTGASDLSQGDLTSIEARELWAEYGLIPREWTVVEEDVEVEDTDEVRQRRTRDGLLSRERVYNAATVFVDEPIVEYSWPANRVKMLWRSGRSLLAPPGKTYFIRKRRDTLYEKDEVKITDEDVDEAIQEGEERLGEDYGSLLIGEPIEEG